MWLPTQTSITMTKWLFTEFHENKIVLPMNKMYNYTDTLIKIIKEKYRLETQELSKKDWTYVPHNKMIV